MLKYISPLFSFIALILSLTVLGMWLNTEYNSTELTINDKVTRLEQDVEELYALTSTKGANTALQNTLAFSVLRSELQSMKKEIKLMHRDLVGGRAQEQAISAICGKQQANRWKDMASVMASKFISGFTKGIATLPIDEPTKNALLTAYDTMLQDTSANQIAWMEGGLDAAKLSERMVTSAVDFRSFLEESLSPTLVNKTLIIAFPDPAMRSQLFQGEQP